MMSVSDWISIICAGVALIVTVIIAVLQIRQSNCMERFEKRQDKRDEQRHQESVKAQAVCVGLSSPHKKLHIRLSIHCSCREIG